MASSDTTTFLPAPNQDDQTEVIGNFIEELKAKRALPLRVAQLLQESHPELATKLRRCLATVNIVENVGTGVCFGQPATCRRRMCPICGPKRSAKFARTYSPYYVGQLVSSAERHLYVVTLSQPYNPSEPPHEGLERLSQASKRLCSTMAKGDLVSGVGVLLGIEFGFRQGFPNAHGHALVVSDHAPKAEGLYKVWNRLSPSAPPPHIQLIDLPSRTSSEVEAVCQRVVAYITKAFPWPLFLTDDVREDYIQAAVAIQAIRSIRTYGELLGWQSRCGKKSVSKGKATTRPKYFVVDTIEIPKPQQKPHPYTLPFLITKK